ncbi:HCLS1-binding protein 3 [Hoplias malabaricus]|uniref:HCLS1-binding protein 3 n=1 Tax=Hoplias malabaricus TaxID=27720 RepID=UPI003462D5C7
MTDGIITSRPLQNEATGIDLQVPQFQEIRGPMMTGHVEYQIVVVTRLAAFKSPKHKPGDVVQLAVSKKYSEIDEFYHHLITQYPTIHLPAMPRKALFVGETDIRDRRAAFDELVRFVSKHPTLSTCPELLEFLGAKSTVRDVTASNASDWLAEEDDDGLDFFGKDEASTVPPERVKKTVKSVKPSQEDEDDDEEELFDPLGGVRSKKPKPVQIVPKPVPKPKINLFDEEDDQEKELFEPAVKDSSLKLFEDPDLGGPVAVGDSLLLSNAYKKIEAPADTKLDEDMDELFRVEEDLDKLLAISKPARPKPAIAPKPKPAIKAKPAVPPKPPSLAQVSGAAQQPGTSQAMNELDILKYIQQNEAAVSEDLQLF